MAQPHGSDPTDGSDPGDKTGRPPESHWQSMNLVPSRPVGDSNPARWSREAVWIGLICLCVRLGIFGLVPSALETDPDAYLALARGWAATGTYGRIDDLGHVVPTAYRPPVYPWLLSWVQSTKPVDPTVHDPVSDDRNSIMIGHALLGAATCLLTWSLARHLGLSLWVSRLAAFLVLIDPILLRQSMLVMTETVATFLSLLAWWLAIIFGNHGDKSHRDRAGFGSMFRASSSRLVAANQGLLLGLVLGVTALCRPTAMAWIGLWGLAEGIRLAFNKSLHRSWMEWVRWGSAGVAVFLVLGFWFERNREQMGRGILTTTHGGYTLYLANNPVLYSHWRKSNWMNSVSREWDEEAFHRQWAQERATLERPTEIELDTFANHQAVQTIRANPSLFLYGCLVRQGWFWAWWPSQRQANLWMRMGIGIWYAVILGLACAQGARWIFRRLGFGRTLKGQPTSSDLGRWLPGAMLLLSLVVVHSVYWSNMRMRAPLVPLVSLLAASGVVGVFGQLFGELARRRFGRERTENRERSV
ncbi:MAG: hypothetical protein ACOYOZ_16435 [Pirellula sp.]